MLRILRWTVGGALAGLGLLCAAAFHERYWRWRDCFNELGRCYDPVSGDVYLEQAGMIWGGLTALFLVCGALIFISGRE